MKLFDKGITNKLDILAQKRIFYLNKEYLLNSIKKIQSIRKVAKDQEKLKTKLFDR